MGRTTQKLSKNIYFLGVLKKKVKLDKNYNANMRKCINFAIIELEKVKSLKQENSREYMKNVYEKLKNEHKKKDNTSKKSLEGNQ